MFQCMNCNEMVGDNAKLALESHMLMIIFFCIMIAFCIGIWVVIIKERI